MPLPRVYAPEKHANGVVDWKATKQEILEGLDVVAEYEAMGIRWANGAVIGTEIRPCYAIGREAGDEDDEPSAAVNTRTGFYWDKGGSQETLSFWNFAVKHGGYGSFVEAIRAFAEKAGVELGQVRRNGKGWVLEEVYEYREADGTVRYGNFRYIKPSGSKAFRQYPLVRGTWLKDVPHPMEGVEPLPYRLPELLASDEDDPVLVVGGEKDALRAVKLGLCATTNHGGEGAIRATWEKFAGLMPRRDYYLIPDNDKAGREHVLGVARVLHPVARSVRIVVLPDLNPKGDLSDWLDMGRTEEELGRLMKHAPLWTPEGPDPFAAVPEPAAEEDDDLPGDDEVSLTCLADVRECEVEWLMPGRIPLRKITLIAGEAKMGKSYLTMDLAARVSVGGPIPCGGGECMPCGSVIILSAEDDLDDTIKPRLLAAGADCSKIYSFNTVRLPNGKLTPFNLAYVDHLEVAIRRFADTRLIIIDPVTHYVGSKVDDNRTAQLREALDPLKRMAYRRGVAIILVTHVNKGTSTKALVRILGSGAYTALARSNWMLMKDPNNHDRRLFLSAGTNLVKDPAGLAFEIVDQAIVWERHEILMSADEALQAESVSASEAKPKKVDQAVEWLRDFLTDKELASNEVFAAGAREGHKRNALFEAKDRLCITPRKEGFGKGGCWFWSLPPLTVEP